MVKLWRHPMKSHICCMVSTPHLAVAAGYAAATFGSSAQVPPLALVTTADNVAMLYSLETGVCHRSFQAPTVEAAARSGKSGGFRRTADFNLVHVNELLGVTAASALSCPARVGSSAELEVDEQFDIASEAVLSEIDDAASARTYMRAIMCPAIDANGDLYSSARSAQSRARDANEDASGTSQRPASDGPGGAAFVVTASDDMHVRIWDLVKPEKSYSITGFEGRENKCVLFHWLCEGALLSAAPYSLPYLLTHSLTYSLSLSLSLYLSLSSDRCTSRSTTYSEPSHRRQR